MSNAFQRYCTTRTNKKARSVRAFSFVLVGFRHAKLPTDNLRHEVFDLTVARNRCSLTRRRVPIQTMLTTLAQQRTAVALQVTNEDATLHDMP